MPVFRAASAAMVVLSVLPFAVACGSDDGAAGADASCPVPAGEVRVGYPTTTLINGQIGQIFQRTDVLERNGLDGEISGFSSGPPANEAMAAGEIDVQFTSEGPAVQAMLAGLESTIVARMGTTRDGVMVGPDSKAQDLEDLRGERIAVPFGTTPYMHLIQELEAAGIDPDEDVELVNIPADALASTLVSGDAAAIAYNEPMPTQIEDLGGRVIADSVLNYALVVRDDYLACHEDDVAALLRATAESASYMSTNSEQVNGWFSDVSKTPIPVIEKAAGFSPIYTDSSSPAEVDIAVSEDYQGLLQEDVDFFAELLDQDSIDMSERATNDPWAEASQDLDGEPVELSIQE